MFQRAIFLNGTQIGPGEYSTVVAVSKNNLQARNTCHLDVVNIGVVRNQSGSHGTACPAAGAGTVLPELGPGELGFRAISPGDTDMGAGLM